MSYQYKQRGYMMNKVFDQLEAIPEGVSYTELHNIYKDVSKGSNSLSYNLANWISTGIFRSDGRYISKDVPVMHNGKVNNRSVYKLSYKKVHPFLDRLFSLHKQMRDYKKYLEGKNASLDLYDPLLQAMEDVGKRIGQCKFTSEVRFESDILNTINHYNKEYKIHNEEIKWIN